MEFVDLRGTASYLVLSRLYYCKAPLTCSEHKQSVLSSTGPTPYNKLSAAKAITEDIVRTEQPINRLFRFLLGDNSSE